MIDLGRRSWFATVMVRRAHFLQRLWFPEGAKANPPLADIYRANLVVIFGWACAFGIGPFIIIAALVLHHAAYGFAPVIAMIALSLLGSAAVDGFRIRLVLQLGKWTRGKRAPIDRVEQPVQYWTWIALLTLILVAKAAGAAVLAYVVLKLARP
jgi:hypothetical protein